MWFPFIFIIVYFIASFVHARSFTYIGILLFILTMPTLLFTSGKNWMLSLAELVSYFSARAIKFQVEYFSREFFTIKLDAPLDAAVIGDLGGTIKIAEAKAKLSTETIKEAFLQKNKQAEAKIIETVATSGYVDTMVKASEKVFFGVSVY